MEYRRLGTSGLKISALSLGSWVTFHNQIGMGLAYECMKTAYEAGVNFFDNAEAYAEGMAETMMGRVIRKAKWKRSSLVISTKIFWGGRGPNERGLSRKHLIEGAQASLKRLRLDYVDLLFCHRPDPETPIEETVRAMTYLVNQGMVLYWGTSEWSAEALRTAYEIARREHLIAPAMEQPQYNMFERHRVETEYAPLYESMGLGLTTWSPLAGGILSGKYANGVPSGSRITVKEYDWLKKDFESEAGKRRIETARRLKSTADELGCTQSQLALAWCLKNSRVSTVITGASRPEQVKENMKALDAISKLTPEILTRIENILAA